MNLVRFDDTWINPDWVQYIKRRPDETTAIFFTMPDSDDPRWLIVPQSPGEVAAMLTGDDEFYRRHGV